MKRLFALTLAVLALCSFTQIAQARRWWGGPAGGDSTLPEISLYQFHQHASKNTSLRYAPVADGVTSWNWPIAGASATTADTLTFTNKIVTGLDEKPTTFGFWIEEPGGGPQSGILVYTSTNDPAVVMSPPLVVGDIVTVTGTYIEFGTRPRSVAELNTGNAVSSTFTFRVTRTGHTTPPAPVKIHPGTIGQGGINTADYCDTLSAEPLEGVLCRMDSVFIQKKYNTNGTGTVIQEANLGDLNPVAAGCRDAAHDTCRIDDKLLPGTDTTVWTLNAQLRSVVGIVSQEFDAYKIWPRDQVNDLVYLGAPPPPDMLKAFAIDNTHVRALFDSRMDDTTATNPANYAMLNSGVTAAALGTDSTYVTLTVSPAMVGGTAEQLSVNGVRTAGFPHTTMIGTESKAFRAGITSISFIQTPGVGRGDTSQVFGEVVTTQGVIMNASGEFGDGAIFLQTPGTNAPFNGIELFGLPLVVARGDNVTVASTIQEFHPSGGDPNNGKTEMGGILYAVTNSSGNALPSPAVVNVSDIKNGSPTAEGFECMLVQTSGFTYQDTCASSSGKDWNLHAGGGGIGTSGADSIGVGQNGTYTFVACPNNPVKLNAILDINGAATNIQPGFRLQPRNAADILPPGTSTGVGSQAVKFALRQGAPNPFSTGTQIGYSIAHAGPVSLTIYNVNGQTVRTLVNHAQLPGDYTAIWDGTNQSGRSVVSGIYYARLTSGALSQTRKMVLSR